MKKSLICIISMALAVAGCTREPVMTDVADPSGTADIISNDNTDIVPGWVRIRLNDDSEPLRTGVFTRGEVNSGNPAIDQIAAQRGATEIRPVFPTDPRFEERHRKYGLHLWFDLKIDESLSVTRAGRELQSVPGVAIVEPHYRAVIVDPLSVTPVTAAATRAEGNQRPMPFDDPLLPLQWDLDNDGSLPKALPGADVGAFDAWKNFTCGDPDVIVAVMDLGVDYEHEDLAANMWTAEDGTHGKNFVAGSKGIINPGEHGTHVAGTIAAVNNNGVGVCGVAGGDGTPDSGVRIMSCQLMDDDYLGDPSAYVFAADNGAIISQNSWGFPASSGITETPASFGVAFDYFIENAGCDKFGNQNGPVKGGLILFAAGNDAVNVTNMIPACDPRVVSVAALNNDYNHSQYSNYGELVDIAAPGGAGYYDDAAYGMEGKILSTLTGNHYGYMNGTSQACPHVSGVAALIASYYKGPGFTVQQLKDILLNSYVPIDYTGQENYAGMLGRGLVKASLMDLKDPATKPNNVQSIFGEPNDTEGILNVVFTNVPADGNGDNVPVFLLDYKVSGTSAWNSISILNPMAPGSTFTYKLGDLKTSTTYDLRVKTQDRYGNTCDNYVEGSGTTGDHVNLPPTTIVPPSRVTLPKKDSDGNLRFSTTVDLSAYFTDPDIEEYGDVLTFYPTVEDEQIVTATAEGNILTVVAHKSGNTIINIKAVDLAGSSIERRMSVVVNQDPPAETPGGDNPGGDNPGGETPGTPSEPALTGSLAVAANPVADILTVNLEDHNGETVTMNIYDAASRRVYSADYVLGQACDVSSLVPGLYNIVVTTSAGNSLTTTFVKY